jgi:hypothetical protein
LNSYKTKRATGERNEMFLRIKAGGNVKQEVKFTITGHEVQEGVEMWFYSFFNLDYRWD